MWSGNNLKPVDILYLKNIYIYDQEIFWSQLLYYIKKKMRSRNNLKPVDILYKKWKLFHQEIIWSQLIDYIKK